MLLIFIIIIIIITAKFLRVSLWGVSSRYEMTGVRCENAIHTSADQKKFIDNLAV